METLTADKMKPVEPLQLPQVADTTDYNALLQQNKALIEGDYNNILAQQAKAQSQQGLVASDIQNTLKDLENKQQDLANANNLTGVTAEQENISKLAQQLSGLNSQASVLNREAQAIPLQLQQEMQGQGVTKAGIAPIESARLRDNAIRALSIAQQADIAQASLTGSQIRLQQAQQKAQEIIDLKYAPKEAKLKSLQAQYTANKDFLESLDKKGAIAYENKLKFQQEQLKTAKENEKSITEIITQAQGRQAPADLVLKASQAKTPLQASVILGQYAGDYLKNELLRAQIAETYSKTAKNSTSSSTSVNRGLSDAMIQNASPEAKNWLKLINAGTISLEDAMTKIGSSKQGLALKNEITTLLAESGAKTQPQIGQLKNVLDSINTLLAGDVEYFGASLAPRIESNPYYMTFKTQLENTIALLTGDNLGLLKGPMSDKDIEFIRNMSAGINEKMDEKTAKARLEQIKARIESKIPTNQSGNDTDSYLDSVEKSLNDVNSASYQPPINMYANSFTR
jgi:hypothetical protein